MPSIIDDAAGGAAGGLPDHLTSHWAWQKLRACRAKLGGCDPFAALGVSGREQSYSQVLAWLLGERRCPAFATEWLDTVLDSEAAPPGWVAGVLTDSEDQPFDGKALTCRSVTTESTLPSNERVDLVAHYTSSDGQRLVLAIENKIHAGESPGQLDAYAKALLRQYRAEDTQIVLVFLTPAGRTPASLGGGGAGDEGFEVRVASWARLASLLEAHPPQEDEEHRVFAGLIARHLKEKLMGETPERAYTRALFEDPECARTLLQICAEQPVLGDMHDAWVERVRQWLEGWNPAWTDITPAIDPASKFPAIREIKITVQAWDDAGLPVRIMVHNDTPHRGPAVRLVIYNEAYPANAETLKRFATLGAGAVDADYGRAWSGFPWYRVLASDRGSDEPAARQVHHYAYNDETVEKCLACLDEQFREIAPAMRRLLEEKR